jgi:hypothetical protein
MNVLNSNMHAIMRLKRGLIKLGCCPANSLTKKAILYLVNISIFNQESAASVTNEKYSGNCSAFLPCGDAFDFFHSF